MAQATSHRIVLLLTGMLGFAGCGRGVVHSAGDDGGMVDPPAIAPALQAELQEWFATHGQPPLDYVVGLFADHDVVLLGEQHRIRHDVLLVQELLPRLHAAGVYVLATEFARRADQELLDSLVTADTWDEALGREIVFRHFMPWGYREYVDVLKAAWQVNHDRPAGSPVMRVIGVNNAPDFSHFKSEADWENPEIRRLVFGSQTEADWAAPVLAAVKNGTKVLVHCGIHHAFTGYRQPRVQDGSFRGFGEVRFGNHLREALGHRAVTVYLHAPWSGTAGYASPFVHPAGGRLDAFMLGRAGGPFPVGFDVAGSPLAELPIENAVYKHGYELFTLADFSDGWIYTQPVSAYQPVAYIDGWINESNVAEARRTAMQPRWRTYSVAQLNEGCLSYQDDFRRFFGHLR
jgi:hypothetical protein